jgi:hypothetical protein
MTPDHIAAGLVAAAATMAALGYIARTLRRGARRIVAATDVILGTDEHPALAERLAWIEGQLKPNGGHSLRDVVNRTERDIKALKEAS